MSARLKRPIRDQAGLNLRLAGTANTTALTASKNKTPINNRLVIQQTRPYEDNAHDHDNVLLQGKSLVLEFLGNTPNIRLRGAGVSIDDELLQDAIDRLVEMIQQANGKWDKMKKNYRPEKTWFDTALQTGGVVAAMTAFPLLATAGSYVAGRSAVVSMGLYWLGSK